MPEHVPAELREAVCGAEQTGRYCYGAGRSRVCLPGFVGLGFEKCGTTKMYDLLTVHPGVCRSRLKEARLLFKVAQWPAYLRQQFNYSTPGCLHGEFTPGYVAPFQLDEALKIISDIKLLLPKRTKFLAGVRDPVTRAYSQYSYHLRHGMDCIPARPCFKTHFEPNATFRDAVCFAVKHLGGEAWLRELAADPKSYPYSQPSRHLTYPHWDILSPGFFIELLRPWFSRLGRSRFFVFDQEALQKDPTTLLNAAFDFLNLPRVDLADMVPEAELTSLSRNSHNSSSHEVGGDQATRRFLEALYSNSTETTNLVFNLRLPRVPFVAADLDFRKLCPEFVG